MSGGSAAGPTPVLSFQHKELALDQGTQLVLSGRAEWGDYFREAVERLSAPFRTIETRKESAQWEAHLATHAVRTAEHAGINVNFCVSLATEAIAAPTQQVPGAGHRHAHARKGFALPQAAIVADRMRWLGLKTSLATFLAETGAEHLCTETTVVHTGTDISPELARRVVPESPWVLKSANGHSGDEVHLVMSAEAAAGIMAEDLANALDAEESMPFGGGDFDEEEEGDGLDAGGGAGGGDGQEGGDEGEGGEGCEGGKGGQGGEQGYGYVLQKHIDRPMLIDGGKKFSLRAYLLLDPDGRMLSYEHDYEVRVAEQPYDAEHLDCRDQLITNGGGSTRASVYGADGTANGGGGWRRMASEFEELAPQLPAIRAFMAECGRRLLPAARPVAAVAAGAARDPAAGSGSSERPSAAATAPVAPIECFELIGLDLMIEKPTDDTPTDGARCWLLEVNSFPASAPFDQWHGKSQRFHEGVVGFATSLLHLMRGAPVPAA